VPPSSQTSAQATRPTLEAFREDVAKWFFENTDPNWDEGLDELTQEEFLQLQRGWLGKLNTRGFGAPHVSPQLGGGGYSLAEQAVIYEEWARSGAPRLSLFAVSLYHVPATLSLYGTEEQRAAYVADAVDGTVWCQGFSEPAAGSDLASLRTRAVRDGDDYVVTGQKVWSSFAHLAKWCLLLARTDTQAPKHRGISYFIMDMESPGVQVVPIKQISGEHEFNEIFLENVRIPATQLIGAENDGWRIAQQTLATERGPIAIENIEHLNVGMRAIVQQYLKKEPGGDPSQGALHERLTTLISRGLAVRSLALDSIELAESDRPVGEVASVIKVASTELTHDIADLRCLLAGQSGLLDSGRAHPRAWLSGQPFTDFLASWSGSLASGTNEIQRNIIAERILGLPREPRP
jgi:alkylation response protein AidB-like acyl-CoA dehydrogenase